MKTTDAFGDLLRMGGAVVTTREAAARWKIEQRAGGQRLRSLEQAGLVRRLRRGLWALDPDIKPAVVPPFLTAPFPAYVSLQSALYRHGMIEQIPRRTFVASLDRTRRIETTIGIYQVHHLAPEVFGGFAGTEVTGFLARPEKAMFDTVYVRAAHRGQAHFPELTLSTDFDEAQLEAWTNRITAKRLRTLVSRHLDEALSHAERDVDLTRFRGHSSAGA